MSAENVLVPASEDFYGATNAVSATRLSIFKWFACAIFFAFWFVNFSNSLVNNWNIAHLQFFFVVVVMAFLRPFPFRLGLAVVLAALFMGSLVLSNLLAEADGIGFVSWDRVRHGVIAVIFGFTVYRWVAVERNAAFYVAGTVAFAVLVYFLALGFYWRTLDNPRGHDWFAEPFGFTHIRHLGYCLCVGMVCSAWAFLVASGRLRWFFLLAFLASISMMLWTGGRGGLLAAALGIGLLLVVFPWRAHAISWWALLACIPVALFLSALFVVDQQALGWFFAVQRTGASASLESVSSGRMGIWIDITHYVFERPWTGWGGEAFRGLRIRPSIVQAHNGPLQLLLEWGIVGTLWISALMGYVLFKGGCQYLSGQYSLAVKKPLGLGIALVGALLALSLVDGIFYHGAPMAFLAAGLGMVAVGPGRDLISHR